MKSPDILCNSDIYKRKIEKISNELCFNLFNISCKSILLCNSSCNSYVIPDFNDYTLNNSIHKR